MSQIIEQIKELMPKGKLKEVNELVQQGLDEGIEASIILNEGLLASMDIIAKRWALGEVFIPEVLIGARCMNSAIEILEPHLVRDSTTVKGKVVIGTVEGDLHDIGKNICALMLKAKSFEVIDVGVDVPAEKFVEAVKTHQPNFVCLSSLLTTSMGNFEVVIDALKTAGLRDVVKVAVGGAPVTQEFANSIGADIYTEDAVSLANELLRHV
jgi:Predicted cobalamin binding protein